MAYQKTVWKNREVEKPRTFRLQNNPDGTVTLLPAEGNIIEAGTPIIAENMNKIEDAVAAVNDEVAQHLAQFNTHLAHDASTTQKGHVQLSSSINSDSEALAATAKAVKTVMDRANEAFQSANDGKTAVANAVTAKGVSASPSDTFGTLATKIGQISTGKKTAFGTTVINGATGILTVSGLAFKPNAIIFMSTTPSAGRMWGVYMNSASWGGNPTLNRRIMDSSTSNSAITATANGFSVNTDWSSPQTVVWFAVE